MILETNFQFKIICICRELNGLLSFFGLHAFWYSVSTSLMKPGSVQEQEVEVSSAVCSGAELVLRVTCKCGVHKEFSFDHRV